jgi:peptidoglycan-associated lipoprotein
MKTENWIVPVLLTLLPALAASGCAKKAKPVTAADLAPPATEASVPAATPEAESSATLAAAGDPWSGDLDAVDAYARSQGLLGDVYFTFDEATLSAEARERLAASARLLRDRPELRLAVEGHCDERGTPEYNLALGERRAQAAKSYLVALGVDGPRLEPRTLGEENPVCTSSDEGCWQQNRRAHSRIAGRLEP